MYLNDELPKIFRNSIFFQEAVSLFPVDITVRGTLFERYPKKYSIFFFPPVSAGNTRYGAIAVIWMWLDNENVFKQLADSRSY